MLIMIVFSIYECKGKRAKGGWTGKEEEWRSKR